MNLPLTYGQCLRSIMQSNGLSINTLSRKMGYRSTTQLSRILNDEVSPTLITKFHQQFMLIFDWLISPAEIKTLSTSLQYSCLGEELFLTQRSMYRMLFEPAPLKPETIPLNIYSKDGLRTQNLVSMYQSFDPQEQIDLLILGSAFDSLLPLFSDLLRHRSAQNNMRIRHAFILEAKPAQVVSHICALIPYLNTSAYTGVYCTEAAAEACRFLRMNQIAVVRRRTCDNRIVTQIFAPPQKDGLSVCTLEGDTLYTFYAQMLDAFEDQLRPIKSVYSQPKTIQSLLTLCERDLFLERDRACCFIRLDLCFHALPTPVVLRALDDGARLGLSPDDPIMQQMCRVHEARYNNLLKKEAPTCFILSPTAMQSFVATGHMSDHLFAMRDFTPQERKEVLVPLADAIRSNDALRLHFFRDRTLAPVGAFAAYMDMGMQISANNTAYDLTKDHSEVFLSLPEFAETFKHYSLNTLIPEYCMDRDASLAFLDDLIAQLDKIIDAQMEG